MVNYKSKYLKYKLKYKNKLKGGSNSTASSTQAGEATVGLYSNRTESTAAIERIKKRVADQEAATRAKQLVKQVQQKYVRDPLTEDDNSHVDVSYDDFDLRQNEGKLRRTVSYGSPKKIGLFHDIIMEKYDQINNQWNGWNRCKGAFYDEAMINTQDSTTLLPPLALHKIEDHKTLLVKWETRNTGFPKWCKNNHNTEVAFQPFGLPENQELQDYCYKILKEPDVKGHDIDKICSEKYGNHTMFFGLYDELVDKLIVEFAAYKKEIEDSNTREVPTYYDEYGNVIPYDGYKITIDDLRFLKNMMLGFSNCEPTECVIIECYTKDLVRVCDSLDIKKNMCNGTDWENSSEWLKNIKKNNKDAPFTGQGYTYAIESMTDNKDKYGVSEVLLPFHEEVMVRPIAVIPEKEFLLALCGGNECIS